MEGPGAGSHHQVYGGCAHHPSEPALSSTHSPHETMHRMNEAAACLRSKPKNVMLIRKDWVYLETEYGVGKKERRRV